MPNLHSIAANGVNPAAPISLHIPRLADFSFVGRSSLVSPAVLGLLVKAAEGLILAGIGFAIARSYVDADDFNASSLYGLLIAATVLGAVGVFHALGLYKVPALAAPLRQMPRLALGWTIALGLLVMALFFLKIGPEISRVWIALWLGFGGVALVTQRLILALLARALIRNGRLTRRAVIFGGSAAAEELIARLEADAESDIRICGVFDDRGSERVGNLVSGYPNLGRLADLVKFSRKTRVDLVIMTMPLAAEDRINQVLRTLALMPVDVRLAAMHSQLHFCSRTYSSIGSAPMLDLADKPLDDWGTAAKWLFDKIVGAIALILLLPVLVAVAIAIKLDSRGPVLFRQKRYGFNNELIEVFKFRSMHVDQADVTASKLVTRNDPRVTPRRPLHPQDQPRRAAAALQRHERLPVAGRATAARPSGQGRRPALRRGRRRLFRPPQGQARHHRLGPDQRLARRDGHRREDPEAGRARPLLHQQLVGVPRSLHPAEDAAVASDHQERLLSRVSVATGTRAVGARLAGRHGSPRQGRAQSARSLQIPRRRCRSGDIRAIGT